MRFVGDVEVSGNPFTQRVWQQNNDYENGTVSYDVDGALPNLLWNRYTNCTLVVPPTALSPVIVRQSEFYNTQIDGQSVFASLTLNGCYRSGGGLTGQSSENAPAPLYPYHLGLALRRQGRLEEARAAFEQALAIEATFEAAARELGELEDAAQDATPSAHSG